MELEYSEDLPTFYDLARAIINALRICYHEEFVEIQSSNKLDSWNITTYDVTCVALMISVLSALRFILTKQVFMPIANHFDIPEASRQKVPECAWKLTYFFSVWCYEWYVVVLSGKYKFFQRPDTMWKGWSLEEVPDGDIYLIYIFACAFYLHSIYTTLFLDTWRKDSIALIVHHISTLILILISQATRCHHIGALTLFLHDVSDIFLEFAKLCSYFRIQGHKIQEWTDMMKNIGFACFIATWFTTRLYWYPLKVVYSAAVHPQELNLHIPHSFTMGILLLGILTLNIYWSMILLKILYRISTGQILEDVREVADTVECSKQLYSDDKCSNSILKRNCSMNFCRGEIDNTFLKDT